MDLFKKASKPVAKLSVPKRARKHVNELPQCLQLMKQESMEANVANNASKKAGNQPVRNQANWKKASI